MRINVWEELPCLGCRVPFLTSGYRLCADCNEALYENAAARIDPRWDRSVMHDWVECWAVLRRLYCWPLTDDIGIDKVRQS